MLLINMRFGHQLRLRVDRLEGRDKAWEKCRRTKYSADWNAYKH